MAYFGDSSAPVRVPNNFELAELMDRILGDWAFLSASPSGRPVPGPAPLELEYCVSLNGYFKAQLVLRTKAALAADLAHASTGDPSARAQGADAFKEFCNLVASHLLSSFLGGDQNNFEPFLPQASTPEQWPSAKPDSEIVVMVDQHPLEARLWIECPGKASRG